MTFEEFLKEAIAKQADVRLRPAQHISDGPVQFYAHVLNHDSSTVDFTVRGNELRPVEVVSTETGN
jgi:hypothetical protein